MDIVYDLTHKCVSRRCWTDASPAMSNWSGKLAYMLSQVSQHDIDLEMYDILKRPTYSPDHGSSQSGSLQVKNWTNTCLTMMWRQMAPRFHHLSRKTATASRPVLLRI